MFWVEASHVFFLSHKVCIQVLPKMNSLLRAPQLNESSYVLLYVSIDLIKGYSY